MNEYEEKARYAQAEAAGYAKPAGGVLHNADQAQNCCASENMRSRAQRKANESASDAVRHERLASKLTPEIENILWCWRESIALGLMDIDCLEQAVEKAQRRNRDRF